MPIYEYICEECLKKFELVRSISQADDAAVCASCRSAKTHRIVSKCFSKGDHLSENHSSGSCQSCSGGSCSHCGH